MLERKEKMGGESRKGEGNRERRGGVRRGR